MVKKKSRKSIRSKKKTSQKKQKRQQKEEKNELAEVSKELYEIRISDLNCKLDRVKQQCVDLERENTQIRESLTQLNEDRTDVISYLSRMLQMKNEDIIELQEQVTTLQQARQVETNEFTDTIDRKENELKKTQERLTTEINLLNGKLNVLDEFRVQKEELANKFELQEKAQQLQEAQHQETVHNIEKDFILKKIRMKKEVEEKLIKLSEDFQTIMQMKIDSTTRVTIVENNALKIEMKKLMTTCKELIMENNNLKSKEKEIQIKYSLLKEELNESIRKYIRTDKKLQKVLSENEIFKSEARVNVNSYLQQIQKLTDNLDEYKINVQRQIEINQQLNQKISTYEIEKDALNEKLKIALVRIQNIENVINQAASAIKTMLWDDNQKGEIDHDCRMAFAFSLLEILKEAEIEEQECILQFQYFYK